jgi:hypothetical protein
MEKQLISSINSRISLEKISPVGNRVIFKIQEDNTVGDESAYEKYAAENNIIRLYPVS